MNRTYVRLALAVLVLAAGASTAWAQGFGVYEQGACAMGRGGASVASPCPDGSSIFFNPAALSQVSTQQLSLGGTFIRPSGGFTDDLTGNVSSLEDKTYPVPTIYYARRLTPRLVAGAGVFAPYGLTTEWPTSSEGRFLGYKSKVQGVYLQPTVAYKVNDRVSVGGGLDIARVALQLRQRVDLSTQPLGGGLTFANLGVPRGTDFADVDIEGHGWSVGYHLGLHVKANERVSFGARYMSGQTVDVENGDMITAQVLTGRAFPIALPGIPAGTPMDMVLARQFDPGAVLSNQAAQTELPLPDQFVAGVAVNVTPKLMALLDYQFVKWSAFDELVIDREFSTVPTRIVESYESTHGIRAGVEYAVTEAAALRAGIVKHGVAAPDQTVTPNLPEGSRWEYTFGFGTKLGNRLRLDAAYQYLGQKERAGRTTDGGLAVPTAALNNGVYEFNAHMFGVTLGFGF